MYTVLYYVRSSDNVPWFASWLQSQFLTRPLVTQTEYTYCMYGVGGYYTEYIL